MKGEGAARGLSWQKPQRSCSSHLKKAPPGTTPFNWGLLGSTVSWLHVSKATKSLISQTLAGELYFLQINQHIEEKNGYELDQKVAWIPRSHWWMGPIVFAKMLTEDSQRKKVMSLGKYRGLWESHSRLRRT